MLFPVFLPATCRRAAAVCGLSLAILILAGATGRQPARADWPLVGWFSDQAEVGTPAWWKKNKKKSTFEVGKGYSVPGVEGYFDEDGRLIDTPIAAERINLNEEKNEDGILPGFDAKKTYGQVKSAVGLGPNEEIAQQAFLRGEERFGAERYGAAESQYKQAVDRAVLPSLKQDAMFMLAESYYFDDKYVKARDAYDALAAKYPSTRHMDKLIDREWSIARYWEQYEEYKPDWTLTPNLLDQSRPKFDTIGHAIKTYDSIRLNDPTGPRADDAIMATASIYFRRGKYDDADYHYTLLRREYPRSEFQFEAHLLGLQAKLRKYQGADYDGAALDEAKQLAKQLRVQFAGRLSTEEKERLRLVNAQVNQEIASRDFRMAKYYDDTKHFGSARVYYAEVLEKYPNTELAQQARDRLTQIAERPDEPAKKLAWLVDLFPESRERTAVARIPELQNGGSRLAEAAPVSGNQDGNSEQPSTVQ